MNEHIGICCDFPHPIFRVFVTSMTDLFFAEFFAISVSRIFALPLPFYLFFDVHQKQSSPLKPASSMPAPVMSFPKLDRVIDVAQLDERIAKGVSDWAHLSMDAKQGVVRCDKSILAVEPRNTSVQSLFPLDLPTTARSARYVRKGCRHNVREESLLEVT